MERRTRTVRAICHPYVLPVGQCVAYGGQLALNDCQVLVLEDHIVESWLVAATVSVLLYATKIGRTANSERALTRYNGKQIERSEFSHPKLRRQGEGLDAQVFDGLSQSNEARGTRVGHPQANLL